MRTSRSTGSFVPLGDRAVRSKTLNESMFAGLLDQYSEMLAAMLDEKLALSASRRESRDDDVAIRPKTSGAEAS